MTQTEETAGLAAQDHSELSPEDLKYLRVGHISTGRFCDKVVAWFVSEIPPQAVLPPRWAWRSREAFTKSYGNQAIWARTASYHLLMFDGLHVLRVWTDSPKSCIVDVNAAVATLVGRGLPVREVPPSCLRKTKPLQRRVTVRTMEEVAFLRRALTNIYKV